MADLQFPASILPSGKHTKSYGKWPFIVDLSIKTSDFPQFSVGLPEGRRFPVYACLKMGQPLKISWLFQQFEKATFEWHQLSVLPIIFVWMYGGFLKQGYPHIIQIITLW
jgi:hypothetical protein